MKPEEILGQVPAYRQARTVQEGLDRVLFELAKTAYFDSLTTLANKNALKASAKAHEPRTNEVPLATLFVDLAGFKALNDSLGHDAGDAGLAKVGRDLAMLAREHEAHAYRHGGDEFVLVFKPEVREDILSQATRLLSEIPFHFEGKEARLRANLGYALPEEGVLLLTLVDRADTACRLAKANDDGKPVMWAPNVEQESPESNRKRCAACGATTTVLVAPSQREDTHLSQCGNQ